MMTRGPLCGASNTTTLDSGTLSLGRSPAPGIEPEPIYRLSAEQKLRRCILLAADHLPSEARTQLRALASPEAITVLVAMIAISTAAQLAPFGWVADIAGFCLGAYALGSSAFQVSADFRQFSTRLATAQSEADMDAAAVHLARAISVIGVGTLLLWLTKRGARTALTTEQLASAAEKVRLNPMDREIAFWSGFKSPPRLPGKYATLEGMLDETPAGEALHNALRTRSDFARDKDVWYLLSERAAKVGGDSQKTVHYFVPRSMGYRAALALGVRPKIWWFNEGRANLVKQITSEMVGAGKSAAQIRERVSALDSWNQERIEAEYYTRHREVTRGNRTLIDDQVFHKLEKLELDGAQIHELDENGNEVGTPFWHPF